MTTILKVFGTIAAVLSIIALIAASFTLMGALVLWASSTVFGWPADWSWWQAAAAGVLLGVIANIISAGRG